VEPTIDVLTRHRRPARRDARSFPGWAAVLLVAAGLAGGYLLGSTGDLVDATAPAATEPVVDAAPPPSTVPEVPAPVRFPGTILASVDFGEGLVAWMGGSDPVPIALTAGIEEAAYDASRDRIAVTVPEYEGGDNGLHVGRLGDLRSVATGVTGFAWHPTDPQALAWVVRSGSGYGLVTASVTDATVVHRPVAALDRALGLVAWGPWGFALQGDDGLHVLDPSGAPLGTADLQLVAAAPDGRLLVARPAGKPLSSDWAFTGPDLDDLVPLGRFADLDEHPTAAAILPRSGRTLLVSNRFGDRWHTGRVELLAPDGTSLAVLRSGFIAESIAWDAGESTVAIAGYAYGPDRIESRVLLVDADLAADPVEVPFDGQIRPLGLRP
jgi:hypothetical protein